MKNSSIVQVVLLCVALAASGCKETNPGTFVRGRNGTFQLLCDEPVADISGNRGISIIFYLEDAAGNPVPSLTSANLTYLDGSPLSTQESAQASVSRPQNIALRALLLIDGSESIVGETDVLRSAAIEFTNAFFNSDIGVADDRQYRELSVQKFFGDVGTPLVELTPYSSDGAIIEGLIERDMDLARRGASTALNAAIIAAVDLASEPPSFPASFTPAVVLNTIVVVTDGLDQASPERASEALRAASNFLDTGSAALNEQRLILGVGIQSPDLDRTFLEQLVESDSDLFIASGASDFGQFREAAVRPARETQKFVQWNFCSPRRTLTRNVSLSIALEGVEVAPLSFSYDASALRDGECDPEVDEFRPCNWTVPNLN